MAVLPALCISVWHNASRSSPAIGQGNANACVTGFHAQATLLATLHRLMIRRPKQPWAHACCLMPRCFATIVTWAPHPRDTCVGPGNTRLTRCLSTLRGHMLRCPPTCRWRQVPWCTVYCASAHGSLCPVHGQLPNRWGQYIGISSLAPTHAMVLLVRPVRVADGTEGHVVDGELQAQLLEYILHPAP